MSSVSSHRLDELLSDLTWSGSTDLSDTELANLKSWLGEFLPVLLTDPEIKRYFRIPERQLHANDIGRALTFCVDTLGKDNQSFEEPEYFGSFYLVVSHIRELAQKAAKTGKRVGWKALKELILSASEIPVLSPGAEAVEDITDISDRRQETGRVPKEEELVTDFHEGALKEVAAIEATYQSLESRPTLLPKLLDILKVVREEVRSDNLPTSKSWAEIWALARHRRRELDELDLARGQAFSLMMKGELSFEEREAVLSCLTLMPDSSVPGSKKPLLSLEEGIYEEQDTQAEEDPSDFLSHLLELVRRPSNKHVDGTSDEQYLIEQFEDFCRAWKCRPVTAVVGCLDFVDQGITGSFEPNAFALRTILALTLITPKAARAGMITLVDRYLEFQSKKD
jgi:hypothetical protein